MILQIKLSKNYQGDYLKFPKIKNEKKGEEIIIDISKMFNTLPWKNVGINKK